MESTTESLKHRELTEEIIGAFYDVYNELGHGFLESVYEQALAIALEQAGMKVERQVAVPERERCTVRVERSFSHASISVNGMPA